MSNAQYSIAVAGSTERTVRCAEALSSDIRFHIPWILTSKPKPIGRTQTLTANPLHKFATAQQIPTILIDKKIDADIKVKIDKSEKINFLLVVDFGYLVPQWLLQLPSSAPLNIHPSTLPKWRGSSPGQFVLLYGEKQSSVTLMIMNESLDEGPILTQLPFAVAPNWTQIEYYHQAFELIATQLPELIVKFDEGELKPVTQPTHSPTPIATRLSRQDGFIPWEVLQKSMLGQPATIESLSSVIQQAMSSHTSISELLADACRAFSPWPGVWTVVKTAKDETRLKILTCHQEHGRLILKKVQLEGKQPSNWNEIKNAVL